MDGGKGEGNRSLRARSEGLMGYAEMGMGIERNGWRLDGKDVLML